MIIRLIGAPLALATFMAGCAGLPDQGAQEVAATLKERGREATQVGDVVAARQLVTELTGKPLGAADVVRIALVNNPALRTQYAELGIAAAEVYDAGRLSNPTLSAAVLFPAGSADGNEASFGLAAAFTDLLLLGARGRLAQGEYERAKLQAGSAVLDLAADAEGAYYRLVGAQQVARMRQAIATAAGTSADLAQRFLDAGNITQLELARERAAASQARLDQLEAQSEVASARAELARILGLRSAEWAVVEQLRLPPSDEDGLAALLSRAEQSRLDLAAGRKQVALLADAVGVSRRFRFLGEVEVGVETTREADGQRLTGPTLSLQLPLFNQGKGSVARSQAQLQQADAQLAELEVAIATGVRHAHADLHNARERVDQYRTVLIPQREEIVKRTLEQVNYMLVGQFELLAAKAEEFDAYQGYLEALRDYWVARTELTRQVGAPLSSSATSSTPTVDVDSLVAPREASMHHDAPAEHDEHRGHDMTADPAVEEDHSGPGGPGSQSQPAQHEGRTPKPRPAPGSDTRHETHEHRHGEHR